MSALPSQFQYRSRIESAARDVARNCYDAGYRSGYAVGVRDMRPRIQQALGLGVLIGTGLGVVLAIVVVGVLT